MCDVLLQLPMDKIQAIALFLIHLPSFISSYSINMSHHVFFNILSSIIVINHN